MSKPRADGLESIAFEFETYEDFLDSQINATDIFYLEDETLARELVELGYRGTSEIIKRDDFNQKKIDILKEIEAHKIQKKALAHEGVVLTDPALTALASREDANRTGKMSTIIFIRDINNKGQEISGYIDYAHRLKLDDFALYFMQKKRFLPKVGDLSDYSGNASILLYGHAAIFGHCDDSFHMSSFYFNWETQNITSNPTENYLVIADNPSGLLFKNKRDRKVVSIDPSSLTAGDNTTRTDIVSNLYKQFVLYDHTTRRKT